MKVKVRKPVPLTLDRYSVIYVDPPWSWKAYSKAGEGRSPSQHYAIMDNSAIMALPIKKLAAKDCALFLWVTFPLLPMGLQTIRSWGFEYKTVAFSWAKTTKSGLDWHMGNGYWTRANVELCLLATRGAPKRVSCAVRQLVTAPVGRHSAKPPEVRSRIVELMGDVSRIELFARERCLGWTATGLELDGRDLRDVLR